jgi:hypothetical protein
MTVLNTRFEAACCVVSIPFSKPGEVWRGGMAPHRRPQIQPVIRLWTSDWALVQMGHGKAQDPIHTEMASNNGHLPTIPGWHFV